MKRLLPFLLCAMLLLCACSKDPYEDIVIDMDALMSDIMATQEFPDPMMVISSDDEEYKDLFDDIIKMEYTEALMTFAEIGISSDMIVIVEALSSEDTYEIMLDLAYYSVERYEVYKGYAPEEAEKLHNCTFETYGKYVIMLVLSDVHAGQDAIAEYGAIAEVLSNIK